MTTTKKLFLASSAELRDDRKEFEIFVNRKNNDWLDKGVFLKLIVWEDFLDAMSQTRLHDEYNRAIAECDIFVMLFWTKVGKYTEEELEHAFKHFKATNKPFIFTYFKDAAIRTGSANREDLTSLCLCALGRCLASARQSSIGTRRAGRIAPAMQALMISAPANGKATSH